MSILKRTTLLCGSILAVLVSVATGCRAVKPYQRAYLNDNAMKLGKMSIEKMDENAQAYREGSSGGGSGKASGGCGCN
jgi:hypothetical protein